MIVDRDKLFSFREGITYQDFNLMPGYIDFHADEVDLSTSFTRNILLDVPFVAAPMDTVVNHKVATIIGNFGGIAIMHYNNSIEEQTEEIKKIPNHLFKAAAVSTREQDKNRVRALIDAGVHVILVDSAQGFSKFQIDMIRFIRNLDLKVDIIGGNIVTKQQAKGLIDEGVDALRVGMGSGSICTTQDVLAVGRAQASSVFDVNEVAKLAGIPVIADGGINKYGHITRALSVGADTVMLGNLIAGCTETPAKLFIQNNREYKAYRGMASKDAIQAGGDKRYGTNLEKITVEQGVSGLVPHAGLLKERLGEMSQALRQSLQDLGVKRISDLKSSNNLKFELRSISAQFEGSPHNLKYIV